MGRRVGVMGLCKVIKRYLCKRSRARVRSFRSRYPTFCCFWGLFGSFEGFLSYFFGQYVLISCISCILSGYTCYLVCPKGFLTFNFAFFRLLPHLFRWVWVVSLSWSYCNFFWAVLGGFSAFNFAFLGFCYTFSGEFGWWVYHDHIVTFFGQFWEVF